LAPPIWALFSKRITGKATIYITMVSLAVNLVFKIILPLFADYKLTRANEMLLGVALPFVLLALYELYANYKNMVSQEYTEMKARKVMRLAHVMAIDEHELQQVRQQNKFGLQVISFSLAFISLLLFVLCFFTVKGTAMVAGIAGVILLCSLIPLKASRKTVITTN